MDRAPSFDTWTSAFLIAVAMGIFIVVLLLSTNTKKVRPIAGFVLAFTLILSQYVLYWTGYQYDFPYLIMLPAACYYATGPLLLWYFTYSFKDRSPRYLWLHFLPTFLCMLPYISFQLKQLEIYYGDLWLSQLPTYYQLIIIHMSIYAILLFRMIRSNGKGDSEFALIRRKWTTVLATLYAIFLAAYVSYYVLVNFAFFNSEWDYAISFTMSAAIYAIGLFIFKKPEIFNGEFYASIFLPQHEQSDSLEQQLLFELYQKIKLHMEQQKPYTNNELRLANLADQLGFSTHLLSKVINQKTGDNFNSFINQYRLADAEKLLVVEQETQIKTIYFEVGFNSKAAFYTAFKKKHNCTPMQYRQQFQWS